VVVDDHGHTVALTTTFAEIVDQRAFALDVVAK